MELSKTLSIIRLELRKTLLKAGLAAFSSRNEFK